MRSNLFAALFALGFLLQSGFALAHHGWSWTSGGNIDLTGVITQAKLGNPHGVLTVDVEGEVWTIEVGQPWRNERAGLKEGDLSKGVEVRVIGEPSANTGDKLLKAEKIYLGDKEYPLYPDRN